MQTFKLERITPESVGISSDNVMNFIKALEGLGLFTHSLLIAKGNGIISETYYKPFEQCTLHRQYSVSKSFISAAVGVAVTEGLFSLDDVIIDYFPEYKSELTDDGLYGRCTVRDMLTMSSNVSSNVYWWGKFQSRAEAYYSQTSSKAPGQLFCYDSVGCFLLGSIIQKLTGMDFLEYLKNRCLGELGFSKESYVLTEPGGYGVGDSGVMCTLRDLLILARLFACRGELGGKRYISEEYATEAISALSYNDIYDGINPLKTGGYGYLIWITEIGFALVGLGSQLALYDRKNDVTLVINSDNQGYRPANELIYQAFKEGLLPHFSTESVEEKEAEFKKLEEFEKTRILRYHNESVSTNIRPKVHEKDYITVAGGTDKIKSFRVSFFDNYGKIELEKEDGIVGFEFGLGYNRPTEFSFGERARGVTMGIWETGAYGCLVSAGFVRDNTLSITLQVIDTYFGKLRFTICFNNDEASMYIYGSGQYVFDGISINVYGKIEKEKAL